MKGIVLFVIPLLVAILSNGNFKYVSNSTIKSSEKTANIRIVERDIKFVSEDFAFSKHGAITKLLGVLFLFLPFLPRFTVSLLMSNYPEPTGLTSSNAMNQLSTQIVFWHFLITIGAIVIGVLLRIKAFLFTLLLFERSLNFLASLL
jgi:hypothetical protein